MGAAASPASAASSPGLALPAARAQSVSALRPNGHLRAARSRTAREADRMRVVILGGYGVFGARLAELLLRDGHDVWIVGRSLENAQALAARIGGHPMAADARA